MMRLFGCCNPQNVLIDEALADIKGLIDAGQSTDAYMQRLHSHGFSDANVNNQVELASRLHELSFVYLKSQFGAAKEFSNGYQKLKNMIGSYGMTFDVKEYITKMDAYRTNRSDEKPVISEDKLKELDSSTMAVLEDYQYAADLYRDAKSKYLACVGAMHQFTREAPTTEPPRAVLGAS